MSVLAGARRTSVLLAVLIAAPCSAQVYLRGQRDAEAGAVESVSPEGVRVSREKGGVPTSVLIGLEQVRDVRGAHSAEFQALQSLAENAWRGRSRIDRGDFAGGEPLLEAIEPKFRGATGPTAGAVYGGLVRSRLARNARGGAMVAWLKLVESRGSGDRATWSGASERDDDVFDRQTSLAFELPPIFYAGSATDVASSAWDELATSSDPRVGELAALYRAAWRFESDPGGAKAIVAESGASDDGVRLVRDIVLSRVGEPAQRSSARERLGKRLQASDIEPWQEAWCRVALGRSLMHESDPEGRRSGVLQALHVPARLARHAPELAAVALAESASTLSELGDQAGAAALKDELAKVAPRHRLLESPGMRSIKSAQATSSARQVPTLPTDKAVRP